jgi:hypothetical protein
VKQQVFSAIALLKDTSFARPLREAYWRRIALRESVHLRTIIRSTGAKILDPKVFQPSNNSKKSAPLFIFGNGASVNGISEAEFEKIGNSTSIGLNAWPLHPFVPDYYSFEFASDTETLDPELEWLVARAEEAKLNSATSLLFLRPPASATEGLKLWLRSVSPGEKILYGRANVITRNRANLLKDLESLLLAIHRGSTSLGVLPDNGSSVVRMVCLGLLAGFSEIVLVGVDLNEQAYFWYEDSFIAEHGDHRARCPRAIGSGTSTLDTSSRPFSTKEFIYALNETARTVFQSKIFVTSKNSALSAGLDVYQFQKNLGGPDINSV